jgi:hypothetical protein
MTSTSILPVLPQVSLKGFKGIMGAVKAPGKTSRRRAFYNSDDEKWIEVNEL